MRRVKQPRQMVILAVGWLLFVSSAALGSGSASADTFPGTRLADNAQHTFCFGATAAVPAADRPRYDQARTYLDVSTDLWDTVVGCNGATDVVYSQPDLPGTVRGRWTCLNVSSTNRCLHSTVQVDAVEIFLQTFAFYPSGGQPFADNYSINVHKTIRHEVGHSIGTNNDGLSFIDMNNVFNAGWGDLRGYTVSGWVPTDLLWTSISPHHRAHVNAAY